MRLFYSERYYYSVRPERHNPASIATQRQRCARLLIERLPCCPACGHHSARRRTFLTVVQIRFHNKRLAFPPVLSGREERESRHICQEMCPLGLVRGDDRGGRIPLPIRSGRRDLDRTDGMPQEEFKNLPLHARLSVEERCVGRLGDHVVGSRIDCRPGSSVAEPMPYGA
jgi:hypothetical protein